MKKVMALAALIFGLGCDASSPSSPSITSVSTGTNTAPSFSIVGADSLSSGTRTQFRALAVHSDGTIEDVTSQTAWSVTDVAVATIDAAGWLTANTPGSTLVVARYQKGEARRPLSIQASSQSSSTGDSSSTPGNSDPPASSPGPGSDPAPGGSPAPTQCLPSPLPPDPLHPMPCPFPLPTA